MSSEYFNQIIGEKLSAVVFVLDYHQLQFDGCGFTILNPITVTSNGWAVAVGDDQFRNRLCDQIAKIVRRVEYNENDSLVIEFEDGSTVSISLKVEDYCGPEAIIFNGLDNQCVVI
jgi:hypothetical protein